MKRIIILTILTLSVLIWTVYFAALTVHADPAPSPRYQDDEYPALGVGVPVSGGDWQVTVKEISVAHELTGRSFNAQQRKFETVTHTPGQGNVFLVISVRFRSLNPAQDAKVSSKELALINENREIIVPSGGGKPDYCGKNCVISYRSTGESVDGDFVFVVPEEDARQVYTLQFQEVPGIPIRVGDQPARRPTTVVSVTPVDTPSPCFTDGLVPLPADGRLTYQRRNGLGFSLGSFSLEDTATADVCDTIAYGNLQLALDGAALLLLGPQRGWPSLYLLDPTGSTKLLVENAGSVDARFDPSGRWARILVTTLGEPDKALYVYDRETDAITQVLKGSSISARYLQDGSLLAIFRADPKGGQQYLLGNPDGNGLASLPIPETIRANGDIQVSDNGRHILYRQKDATGVQRVLAADIDGSNIHEVTKLEGKAMQRTLSADGDMVMVRQDAHVTLYYLPTGQHWSIPVNGDSNPVTMDFSPSGRWAYVRDSLDTKAAGASYTYRLSLVDTANGAIRTLDGEGLNGFFSPDETRFAYTLRHPDGPPTIHVLLLEEGTVRTVGEGVLTGWFASAIAPAIDTPSLSKPVATSTPTIAATSSSQPSVIVVEPLILPTPIPLRLLGPASPSPLPVPAVEAGTAAARGQILCVGIPIPAHTVFLLKIEDRNYRMAYEITTDDDGYWHKDNIVSGEYIVWVYDRPSGFIGVYDSDRFVLRTGDSVDLGILDMEECSPAESPGPDVTPSASVTPTPTPTPALPDAEVKVATLNLRDGPGTDFPVLDQIHRGDSMTIIGKFGNCAWLKVITPQGDRGWVSGASQYITRNLNCDSIPLTTFRPLTGTIVQQSGRLDGRGKLTVENGTNTDGVVVLAMSKERPVVSIYMRMGENYTLHGVRDDTYQLFFTTGHDWAGNAAMFTRNRSFYVFEDLFSFRTTTTTYSTWRVTLHGVVGGTAGAERLSEDEFPRLWP